MKHLIVTILATAIFLVGCGSNPTTTIVANQVVDSPTEQIVTETSPPATGTAEVVVETATVAPTATTEVIQENTNTADLPSWYDHAFTDAATGQAFTINDFQGKVVLVEMMAMWCSNCMRQQNQVIELHSLLGERDDFQSIGIDVDPYEQLDQLSGFVANNGFDWLYGVSPVEVSREISALYGDEFLSPPFTPMMIIDKQGNSHPLPFTIKSAADLLTYLTPFLNE